MREGDTVVAVVEISARDTYVPAGTEGVLIDVGGMFSSPQVAFTLVGSWLSGDRTVVVEVDPRDIADRG